MLLIPVEKLLFYAQCVWYKLYTGAPSMDEGREF
jgi:hypothetical protein